MRLNALMPSPSQWSIGLIAAMLVGLEIVWTRIFSAEFFYSFAFLTVSLAVMGLGLGALLLRLRPNLARTQSAVALLAGMAAAIGPPLVLRLGIDFTALWREWHNIPLVLLGVLVLMAPHLGGGLVIASILKNNRSHIAKIYMADLIGAASGGLAAVWLMNTFGVPAAAALCCLFAIVPAWGQSPVQKAAALLLGVALTAYALTAAETLVPSRKEPAPIIAQHWDTLGKIKIYVHGAQARSINIDNAANMTLHRVKTDWRRQVPGQDFKFRLDFRPLIAALNLEKVMVIGAGGGSDVLQAKLAGADQIHAVEVNSALNQMLLDGDQASFSGHLYRSDGLWVVSEDARTYAKRYPDHFDLILSRSANTFAALASGAFALAENFIFTKEAFADFYRALTPNGVLLIEHQVYIPRLVSAALLALEDVGVEQPADHLTIFDLPTMHRQILIITKRPLKPGLVENTLEPLLAAADGKAQLLHPTPTPRHLVSRIVADGWQTHWAQANIDITPPTDDRPFVALMGRWDRLEAGRQNQALAFEFKGFPLAKLMMLAVLVLVALGGGLLLLLPLKNKNEPLQPAAWFYFAAIGIGYMLVEVVWIQQYSLFLGNAAYTFAIVLLVLLLSSGLGSAYAHCFGPRLPFIFVALWLVAAALVFPAMASTLGALSWGWRVLLSGLAIAPVGFFMGMPFPKAAARVGPLVDWGFAINGIASVFGATLAVFGAIHVGFAVTLTAGALCYLFAMFLLSHLGKS